MIKMAIVGVVATIIALQFTEKPEYGVYIGIAMSVVIAFFVISKIEVIIETINTFERYIAIDIKYIKLLLKMIGITYIAEISSSMCKDVGYSSISKQIEIGGKVTILAISIPIVFNLLDMVTCILK